MIVMKEQSLPNQQSGSAAYGGRKISLFEMNILIIKTVIFMEVQIYQAKAKIMGVEIMKQQLIERYQL